jgi:hypothetical protein
MNQNKVFKDHLLKDFALNRILNPIQESFSNSKD